MTIAGNGRYNDIGRFVADFENAYPVGRIGKLSRDVQGVVRRNSTSESKKLCS
jgi:hypothetical protein